MPPGTVAGGHPLGPGEVSILVVVDHAPRAAGAGGRKKGRLVSILVVVDHAPRERLEVA